MSYRYYLSGSPSNFISTGSTLIDGFQALLNEQFENSSTVFTIQEETAFASGSMTNIRARVNRAVSSVTGEKLGDDFKTLLFKNISHPIAIGRKYYFDSEWWITVFTEAIKNLAASCTVRRANNLLRWVDANGNLFSEPISIDYPINRPSDSAGTTNPVEPEGFIRGYTQLNSNTKYLKEGQRFLFGNSANWRAFQIFGGGIRNFLETSGSCNLLQIIMNTNYVNEETDDIVNGIADSEKVSYAISTNISSGSISGSPGMGIQVSPIITRNLIPVNENISYTTSASPVASVSGSGLVTLIATGSATITASMTDNVSIHSHVTVIVSSGSVANYEIRVTPDTGYILEGDTESYTVFLYLNGTIQSDVFTFSIANANVPAENYIFTVTGDNGFNLHNHYMYMNDPLLINAVSSSQSKQISILLKGAW